MKVLLFLIFIDLGFGFPTCSQNRKGFTKGLLNNFGQVFKKVSDVPLYSRTSNYNEKNCSSNLSLGAVYKTLSYWMEKGSKWIGFATTNQQYDNWQNGIGIMSNIQSVLKKDKNIADKLIVLCNSKGKPRAIAVVGDHQAIHGQKYLTLEYLVAAPHTWGVAEHKKRKGAGMRAFTAVVNRSKKEGLEGRVYLEALPEAAPFYRKLGMTPAPSSKMLFGNVSLKLDP